MADANKASVVNHWKVHKPLKVRYRFPINILSKIINSLLLEWYIFRSAICKGINHKCIMSTG